MTVDRRAFLIGLAATATGLVAAACGGDSSSSSAPTTTLPSSTTAPPTTLPPTTAPAGPAQFVTTGPTTTARVALTFHTNGDLGLVDQLLAALAASGTTMTAFIVGDWLEANPTYATRLLDAGHELANHTYDHPSGFAALPVETMTDEVVRCRDIIVGLTGSPGAYFRPSGTADGTSPLPSSVLEVAGTNGYPTVLGFDVDPYDYQDPGANAVASRVLDSAGAGSIVSLHFDHPGTIAAVPSIVEGLRARGLAPGTASALLAGA